MDPGYRIGLVWSSIVGEVPRVAEGKVVHRNNLILAVEARPLLDVAGQIAAATRAWAGTIPPRRTDRPGHD